WTEQESEDKGYAYTLCRGHDKVPVCGCALAPERLNWWGVRFSRLFKLEIEHLPTMLALPRCGDDGFGTIRALFLFRLASVRRTGYPRLLIGSRACCRS